MDAKLTPEQVIGVLKWIRIQCDSQLKKEIDRIVKYIESLAADAKIGQAAVKAKHDKALCDACYFMHYMSDKDMCERCECHDFCKKLDEYDRLRAGKGGE